MVRAPQSPLFVSLNRPRHDEYSSTACRLSSDVADPTDAATGQGLPLPDLRLDTIVHILLHCTVVLSLVLNGEWINSCCKTIFSTFADTLACTLDMSTWALLAAVYLVPVTI